MKTISIGFVWKLRLALQAEGDKLWAEGGKLRAEGDKLRAEGDKLWAEGVLEAYGNVTIDWKSDMKCIIDGTDIFDKSI